MDSEKKTYITCKPWQLLLWPCHSATSNFFMILMMFTSYIATGGYGILVATVGYIATATRLLDGFIDPFLVMLTDRVNSKFGRVRILIILGRGIQILTVFAMFFWGIGGGIVAYTAIYAVYVIGASISAIATHTGNPVLTTDPKQRPKIFRWQIIYSTVFGAIFQMVLSTLLLPKYGELSVPLFQEMAILVSIIAVVFEVLAMIGISPADKPGNFPKKANNKNVNFKDMWNLLTGNRAMQMYVISAVSDKIASQASTQAAITTLIYGIVIANYEFSGAFQAYTMIPNILIILLGTQLMGRTGGKKALVQWTAVSAIISAVIVMFMTVIDPTSISQAAVPTVIFLVLCIAQSAAVKMTSAVTNSLVPDIVDYELARTGSFMPGTVGTLYSFIDELLSSLSTTIVGLCLTAIGYVSAQPQPGDPCTAPVYWMAMFLWMGLPILGWICTLIAMHWYPLTKEKMEEVEQTNARIRAERAAAKSE